jgi:hypothetical protein
VVANDTPSGRQPGRRRAAHPVPAVGAAERERAHHAARSLVRPLGR